MAMTWKCPRCGPSVVFCTLQGGTLSLCGGDATITSSIPPPSWTCNWLKCTKHNCYTVLSGGDPLADDRRRLEEEKRKLREAQERARREREAYERRQREIAAERARQQRELERRAAELKRQQLRTDIAAKERERQTIRRLRGTHQQQLDRHTREHAANNKAVADLKAQCDRETARLRSKFPEEYAGPGVKRVVLLGITGSGKSTFGNRLCGDTSDKGDQGPFLTSDRPTSATKAMKAHAATVHGVRLSVVDTPGLFDTDGDDRAHANELVEYLKGCGGVNAFLIFKNGTHPRLDAAYQGMLDRLTLLLGKRFYRHVVIVAPHVEPGRPVREFAAQQAAFRAEVLRKQGLSGDPSIPLPMVGVGLDNYQAPVRDVLAAIPSARYQPEAIQGPLDELRAQLAREQAAAAAKQQQVSAAQREVAKLDAQERQLGADIARLQRQV